MLDLPEETQIIPDTALLYSELTPIDQKDILTNALQNSPVLNIRRLSDNVLDHNMRYSLQVTF